MERHGKAANSTFLLSTEDRSVHWVVGWAQSRCKDRRWAEVYHPVGKVASEPEEGDCGELKYKRRG